MVFAGVLLLLYLFLIKRRSLSFRKGQLWRLFLLASFNIYLTNIFEFWGLQHLTSSKACFIYSLSPFIAALFSYFLLSEMMSPKKWMGLIIGFLGFIPIFLSDSTSEQGLKSFLFFSWPELCVMIAAAASVYGWILLKQLVSEDGFSPLEANGVSMFFGGGMALLHSYFTESWTPVPVKEMAPFLK
jgi:drug/metabolite transporter (DMT)-like permease